MKKNWIAALAAVSAMAMVLGGCGTGSSAPESSGAVSSAPETAAETEEETEEGPASGKTAVLLALEDSVQTDAVWDGIRKYSEEYNYTSTTVDWRGSRTEDRLEELVASEADAGFSAVFCYGEAFGPAVRAASEAYPDTRFVLLGASGPFALGEGKETAEDNVYILDFSEEQAGFLAGFSAVADGSMELGFIGKEEDPSSTRFGYGFIQGADAAALEREREISVKYACVGEDPKEAETLAASWFDGGCDLIFAPGREAAEGVLKAAEEKNGLMMVSGPGSMEPSDRILAVSELDLSGAVYRAFGMMDTGEWKGGTVQSLKNGTDAPGIDLETSRFSGFSEDEYQIVTDSLKAGDYAPVSDRGKDGNHLEISDLTLTNTEVRTVPGEKEEEAAP